MKIEDAIEQEIKTAGYKRNAAESCRAKLNNPNYPWGRDWTMEQVEEKEKRYIKEAEEHQQMAEWLKEFRELKEKAIKKVEKCKDKYYCECGCPVEIMLDSITLKAIGGQIYCDQCGAELDYSEILEAEKGE